MGERAELIDSFRRQVNAVTAKLEKSSLARLKEGARRDFIARDFMKKFKGVSPEDLGDAVEDWMMDDSPAPASVQNALQIMLETGNDHVVDVILDRIGTRMQSGERKDIWWAENVLEPFEHALRSKPKIARRINDLCFDIAEALQST